MCHLDEIANHTEPHPAGVELGKKAAAHTNDTFWAMLTRKGGGLTMRHGSLDGRTQYLGRSPMQPWELEGYCQQENGKSCDVLYRRSQARNVGLANRVYFYRRTAGGYAWASKDA